MHEAGQSKTVLWDNPEGWGGRRDVGGGSGSGGHMHPWVIHVDVWQNPPQYCNSPPIKINTLKKILARTYTSASTIVILKLVI